MSEVDGSIRCTCEWAHPVDGSLDAAWPAEIDPGCLVHREAREIVGCPDCGRFAENEPEHGCPFCDRDDYLARLTVAGGVAPGS